MQTSKDRASGTLVGQDITAPQDQESQRHLNSAGFKSLKSLDNVGQEPPEQKLLWCIVPLDSNPCLGSSVLQNH